MRLADDDTTRSGKLRAARDQKMAQYFAGRRWRVAEEVTLEDDNVVIRKGEFWVKDGKVFRTPFGNKGVHGYILQEVDPKGRDIHEPGDVSKPSRAAFGWVTIKHASEQFPGSIVEVPPRPYGRRGGVGGPSKAKADSA